MTASGVDVPGVDMSGVRVPVEAEAEVADRRLRGRFQRLLLAAVEAYQRAYDGRPSPCRFYPTCSTYAHEAIAVHGAARGGWLALRRLVRCRPFGPSGFDPVPSPDEAPPYGRDHVPPAAVPAPHPDAACVPASQAAEKG